MVGPAWLAAESAATLTATATVTLATSSGWGARAAFIYLNLPSTTGGSRGNIPRR